MPLSKTKEILKRLYDKYSEDLKYAKQDIKPDYSARGIENGYSYYGIDDNDRDFIYNSIGGLSESVNNAYGPIYFDIENHYITESKAIKDLDFLKDYISKEIATLKDIQKKYLGKEHSKYPIQVCLSYHEQVYEILEEIYNSDEFKEFKKPGQLDMLKNENSDLKFIEYWRKLKLKYIIHLTAFIPFLAIAAWIITHKDEKGLSIIGKTSMLVGAGLITIFFNLLFNNHNSFKDSWKLLSKTSRENLRTKERENFLKSLQ